MKSFRLPRVSPGERFTARLYNELAAGVERLSGLPSLLRHLSTRQERGFWARITGGAQPYSWDEVYDDPDAAAQFFLLIGRSGESNAYESTGDTTVHAGTIVWMKMGAGGPAGVDWRFQHVRSGARSPATCDWVACAFVTGCAGKPLPYSTACLWHTPRDPATGLPVAPDDPLAALVACCVTGPDGKCCVAVPRVDARPDSYTWTASHARYFDGRTVVHMLDCVAFPYVVTQVALLQSEIPLVFEVVGCGCGLPGATVRVFDAAGTTEVASGKTDDQGFVTLYIPAAVAATNWRWKASHPDYTWPSTVNPATGIANTLGAPAVGTEADGAYDADHCVWHKDGTTFVLGAQKQPVALAIGSGHYCFGGPQPPGTTDVLPGTVSVTLSNWAGFGTLAGRTIACDLKVALSGGSTAFWQSDCQAMDTTYSVFAQGAKVGVSMVMGVCGPTRATAALTLYSSNACNAGTTLITFDGDPCPPGRIYDPVAFESDGAFNNGGVVEHFSFLCHE